MKRFFVGLLCCFIPWAIFLRDDLAWKAFVALMLQASLLFWPVAVYLAWKQVYPTPAEPQTPANPPAPPVA